MDQRSELHAKISSIECTCRRADTTSSGSAKPIRNVAYTCGTVPRKNFLSAAPMMPQPGTGRV